MDTEEHRFLQKRKFKLLGRWSLAPAALACRLRQLDPGRFRSLIFHAFDDLLLAAREGALHDPLINRSPLLIRFNIPGVGADEEFQPVLRAGGEVLIRFVEEDGFVRRFGAERSRAARECIELGLERMIERERQTVLGGGIPVPYPYCSHCGKEMQTAEHSHN